MELRAVEDEEEDLGIILPFPAAGLLLLRSVQALEAIVEMARIGCMESPTPTEKVRTEVQYMCSHWPSPLLHQHNPHSIAVWEQRCSAVCLLSSSHAAADHL